MKKIIEGYERFREKYAKGDDAVMQKLASQGQRPDTMIVACCDSRVDPALILQCNPGDFFIVRNVANIIPPYEKDNSYHGTSAALEYGICYLNVKHLIILGHSQCGGIQVLLDKDPLPQDDFLSPWVSILKTKQDLNKDPDLLAQEALLHSKDNAMTFPWIDQRIQADQLAIHLWFFDIKTGQIFVQKCASEAFVPLQDLSFE